MYSLERFQERLAEEFHDRLRIRYSKAEDAYVVEEKVGRGAATPHRHRVPGRPHEWVPIELDDTYIRARDGYAKVLSVRLGDRMPCPVCGLAVKVPVMTFGEARCSYCAVKERRSRYTAAFFPLGETLMDHLKSIDPLRSDTRKRIQAEDEAFARERKVEDKDYDAGFHDELFDVAIQQIPKVGYTGREKAWVRD
jgi:hypothetical protein